jgi:methionine synthase I (cobalamin-dependent)
MSIKEKFKAQLTQKPMLCDGAMGTMIYGRGIPFERCFDELNVSQPALIAEIHRDYIAAGADIIQTNTFGANRFRLVEYGLENQVTGINQAGVELARRTVDASYKTVLIAGTIGPLGQWLAPIGRLRRQQVRQAFREQVSALIEAGVDLIVFDTFADLSALKEAVLVTRELSDDIPIITQVTFNDDMRTPLGHTPQKVADRLGELPIDVAGINCSLGPSGVLRTLRRLAEALPAGTLLSAQPNAGWPERRGGRIMYPATPDYFSEYTLALVEAGARVVGGCCGTTATHIARMRTALDAPVSQPPLLLRLPADELDDTTPPSPLEPTRLAQRLAANELVVTIEVSPPKGTPWKRPWPR